MGFRHFSLLIVTDDDDDDTCGNSESVLGGYAHSYFFLDFIEQMKVLVIDNREHTCAGITDNGPEAGARW